MQQRVTETVIIGRTSPAIVVDYGEAEVYHTTSKWKGPSSNPATIVFLFASTIYQKWRVKKARYLEQFVSRLDPWVHAHVMFLTRRRAFSVKLPKFFIGRAGASPPSRTNSMMFLYIQVNEIFYKLERVYRYCIKITRDKTRIYSILHVSA